MKFGNLVEICFGQNLALRLSPSNPSLWYKKQLADGSLRNDLTKWICLILQQLLHTTSIGNLLGQQIRIWILILGFKSLISQVSILAFFSSLSPFPSLACSPSRVDGLKWYYSQSKFPRRMWLKEKKGVGLKNNCMRIRWHPATISWLKPWGQIQHKDYVIVTYTKSKLA